MSAKISLGSGGWRTVADVWMSPRSWGTPNDGLAPSTPFWLFLLRYDLFFNMISNYGVNAFGSFHAFSTPNISDGVYKDSFLENPVTNVKYDSLKDQEVYGSAIHNLKSFIDVLSVGKIVVEPGHTNEHPCIHPNFKGQGFNRVPGGSLESRTASMDGVYTTSPWVNAPILDRIKARTSTKPLGWDLRGWFWPFYSWDTFCSLGDVMLRLSEQRNYWGGGTQHWRSWFDITDVKSSSSWVSFKNRGHVRLSGPYFPYDPVEFDYQYHFWVDINKCLQTFYWEGPYSWEYYTACDPTCIGISFQSSTCSSSSFDSTWSPNYLDDHLILPRPFLNDVDTGGTFTSISSGDRDAINTHLSLFTQDIEQHLHGIRSAATFSTVKAIESIERGTTTDVLQSLVKLPDWKSMLPQIKEAISILGKIAKKDLSLSTFKEILDLAASTQLQASFQWRPWIQLLLTELPKMFHALANISTFRRVVIGRGSQSFTLKAGILKTPGVRLTSRTKMVLDVSGSTLMSTFLGWDGLGILPKPSTLWDLVPFSFALNWFTGVGQSLKRAEYASLLLTIPGYFVHTFSLSAPFTEDEMIAWRLSSLNSDPLSWVYYRREVSIYSPLPYDSEFGFGIPSSLPPIGTLGALLYQIFI